MNERLSSSHHKIDCLSEFALELQQLERLCEISMDEGNSERQLQEEYGDETEGFQMPSALSRIVVVHNPKETLEYPITPSSSSDSLNFENKSILKRKKLIKSGSSRRTPRSRPVMVVRFEGAGLEDCLDGGMTESGSTNSRWDEFGPSPDAQSSPLIKPKRAKDGDFIDPRS